MILNPTRMANPNGPVPAKSVVNETLREASEHPIALVATYTATSFDLFYVAEEYRESFDDEAALKSSLGGLAHDIKSEFVERGLFAGMRPVHDRVEYRSTGEGDRKCLQIFCGGVGMLLLVDPDEAEEPLAGAAARLLGNQL